MTSRPAELGPRLSPGLRAAVELLGDRARPEVGWMAKVAGRSGDEGRAVLEEIGDQLALEEAIARILESTGRTYYAQFPAPLELYGIARFVRPQHVVESGVSSGLSSAHLLMALQRNGSGRLHSMDLPMYQRADRRRRGELSWSIPKGKESGWAIPDGLKVGWDLRKGRSEDLLQALVAELPAIDLYCHDSPWTAGHLAFEFETIAPKLRSGSIVVADNTDHNPGAVLALAGRFGARVWHRRNSSLVGIRIP